MGSCNVQDFYFFDKLLTVLPFSGYGVRVIEALSTVSFERGARLALPQLSPDLSLSTVSFERGAQYGRPQNGLVFAYCLVAIRLAFASIDARYAALPVLSRFATLTRYAQAFFLWYNDHRRHRHLTSYAVFVEIMI